MIPKYHTITREWDGLTAYIVAGGTSVATQDLAPLRTKKVIVTNSSYEAVPFAQKHIFGDTRWYEEHKNKTGFIDFMGDVYGSTRTTKELRLRPFNRLRKFKPPPGLVVEHKDGVIMSYTVLHAAMNLAFHLGVARMVLIGADMGRAKNGQSHHHTAHKWKNKKGNKSWDRQMEQLELLVPCLKKYGIEVFNASPISRLPFWPKIKLEDAYARF